jgi:hypothetical protein
MTQSSSRTGVAGLAGAVHYDGTDPWLMGIPLDSLHAGAQRIRAKAFVLGACEGGSPGFVNSIRRALAGPTAFLGCSERASYAHGDVLWAALFEACEKTAAAGRRPTPARLAGTIGHAQHTALSARPRMRCERWSDARVLQPLR